MNHDKLIARRIEKAIHKVSALEGGTNKWYNNGFDRAIEFIQEELQPLLNELKGD